MGAGKKSYGDMLYYRYAILVCRGRSMGMVSRGYPCVYRFNGTHEFGCATAVFRIYLSLRGEIEWSLAHRCSRYDHLSTSCVVLITCVRSSKQSFVEYILGQIGKEVVRIKRSVDEVFWLRYRPASQARQSLI